MALDGTETDTDDDSIDEYDQDISNSEFDTAMSLRSGEKYNCEPV